ncbi:MAG: hypothetical protein ACOY0T_15450 [Myxococcota bacterium]
MISKLRTGVPANDYLELARNLRTWLASRPGFVSCELYVGEPNTFAHRVVWRTFDDAQKSAKALAETEIGWGLSELVQPDPHSFFGRRIDEP